MRIIKGWKKISNQGGYINETTGQTLIVAKKDFSQNYHVSLYAGEQTIENESKRISPEFSNESKAEVFAYGLDGKAPERYGLIKYFGMLNVKGALAVAVGVALYLECLKSNQQNRKLFTQKKYCRTNKGMIKKSRKFSRNYS